MKRIKYILFTLILMILVLPNTVKAAEFSVDDNMTMNIDDSLWYVFTRNNIKDNKELESLGMTYEYMENFFNTNSAYLDAILLYKDTGEVIELCVRKVESDGPVNSNNYSDEEYLESLKEFLSGNKYTKLEIYQKDNYKYGYSEYVDKNVNIMEYYIIINKNKYTITVQKQGDFDSDNKARIKDIIDNTSYYVNSDIKEPTKGIDGSEILKKALIGAVIGGAIGGIVVGITAVVKKKKKNPPMNNNGYYDPNNQYYNNGYNNNNYYNNGYNDYNNNGNYYNNNNNNNYYN